MLLHLAPDDPEPLRHQIVRQLRDRITRGKLEAGHMLPGHRSLARQHRVAPSTVEAAYAVLEHDGLLIGAATAEPEVARIAPEQRRRLTERMQLEHLVQQELGKRELEMARDVQRRLLPPSEIDGPGWQVAPPSPRPWPISTVGSPGSSGEFVALTMARFRPAEQRVELANAGAPDPYVLSAGGSPKPVSLPGPRLPSGARAEIAYASTTVALAPGERLLLLTDGLPEARTSGGEPLGYETLETMLADDHITSSPGVWLAHLFDAVQRATGLLPEDDWTAAVLAPTQHGGDLR